MQVSYQFVPAATWRKGEHLVTIFCTGKKCRVRAMLVITGRGGFGHESITIICASIGILIIFHTVLYPPAIVID